MYAPCGLGMVKESVRDVGPAGKVQLVEATPAPVFGRHCCALDTASTHKRRANSFNMMSACWKGRFIED